MSEPCSAEEMHKLAEAVVRGEITYEDYSLEVDRRAQLWVDAEVRHERRRQR